MTNFIDSWKVLSAVAASALLVACGGSGTGNNDTPDAGNNPVVDAGQHAGEETPTDAGTDAGTVTDNDVVVARFNADGTRDTSFGNGGMKVLDLAPSVSSATDVVWGLSIDSQNRAVVFANSKGAGDRTDADRAVVRLTTDGELDSTFGTNGVQWLDIGGNIDNARHGFIAADGKIVASGYSVLPTGVDTQKANHIVLARYNADGSFDTSFGTEGVVSSNPFKSSDATTQWGMAEAYAVRPQGSKYITTGYGRAAATGTVDLVSFRYTETGELDTTWGTNGYVVHDLVGQNDRGRDLVVLPDNRVLMVGSGMAATSNIDPMLVMLTEDGALDTSFETNGYKLFDLGRPDEALFGVAVAPNGSRAAAVGFAAGKVNGQDADDDAVIAVLPLDGSASPVVQAAPISDSENDRFFGVAYGSDGKIYATGFVNEGGDTRIVVARFNADGTADTSFGTEGVARLNAVEGGTEELGRAIALQSDGKILVVGTVKHLQ